MHDPRGDADDKATPAPEHTPVRLGHYVLLHTLGKGGMGIVYAAYDERLDRRVAIKLLRARSREKAQTRLKREAQALARLSHPNVVQIYEIGELDERPFLVMELIEGITLGQWRAERTRTRAEILDVFLAAGRGLAAAHAKGLVHRDFKPDNVMIRRDGQVVVMDFGLARGDERSSASPAEERSSPSDAEPPIADAQELDSERPHTGGSPRTSELEQPLTVAGKVLGTPGYMAPEQLAGEPVHASCDQFSFCVALWEALYEQRPFRGRSLAAFARSVLKEQPRPPEASEVPAWLRKVLERGLARSPEDRWPSMNALLDALQHDPTQRRRRVIGALGVLACACVAALAIPLVETHERDRVERERDDRLAVCEREAQLIITNDWNDEVASTIERAFSQTSHPFPSSVWEHTRPWLDDYAREWAALRTQTCMDASEDQRSANAEAVSACLDEGRIAFAAMLDVLSSLTTEDAQMVTNATSSAARLPPPSSCTSESLLRQVQHPPAELRDAITKLRTQLERARARSYAGDHARALVEAQAVLEQAEALAWRPLLVRAGSVVAFVQLRLGKYEDARRSSEQAFLRAAASDDELGMLLAAAELATVLGSLARYDDALRWAKLATELVDRLELAGSSYEAQVLTRFAALLTETGAYEQALTHQQRALQIYESTLGAENPTAALVLLNLGVTQDHLGQHQAALDSYRRGIEIVSAVQGPEHSNLGYFYNSVGTTLVRVGDLEGSLVAYQSAVKIWEAALGSEHPTVALAQSNLGSLRCRKNQCDEGLRLHRRALQTLEAKQGPTHPQVGTTLLRIGSALREIGSYDDALEHHQRALEILEAAKGPEHADVLVTRIDIGAVLREQGHAARAVAQIRPALEVLERIHAPESTIREALVELGLALLDTGEVAAALAMLERALPLFEQDLGGIDRARASFSLARALWAAGEHTRARELAETARELYRAGGEFGARDLAEVEAWLSERP